MGRKSEIAQLKRGSIEVRKDGSVWIKLPKVKKYSSDKNKVELWSITKEYLMPYLESRKFKEDDVIFPSTMEAYTKDLRGTSEELYGRKMRLTPKTLRKI